MKQQKAISQEELEQFRNDIIGTKEKIHFNNAGSSLPPDIVVDTVVRYLQEEARLGGYETEAKYKTQLEATYDQIARLINAERDEVAVVENASMAWGLAFNGIRFLEGDVVITSEMEYITNLMGFIHLEKTHGIKFKVIPNDASGNFPLGALEEAITPETKLIAVTHVASTAGAVLPVVEIGHIAKKHQVLYMVDACQSVGQMPIDVKAMSCDILSVTGRKYLRAPRGTGFLFVKKEIQDQLDILFIDGHTADFKNDREYRIRPDGRRFELYEKSRALTMGLGKAVEYAMNIGLERIWQRIQYLASILRKGLHALDEIEVHDSGTVQCGIVTFSIRQMDSQEVKNKLSEQGINVSVGLAKSTLIYMNKHELSSVVRVSIHYYNTEEEIDVLCKFLADLEGKGE